MTETVTLATTKEVPLTGGATRLEHDLLGDTEVPNTAYWGVHTKRAVENFPITGVPVGHFPELVKALAMVKQAAARANKKLAFLARDKAEAIERACELIIQGHHHDQFVVDAIQGGAGTSTNMNANEVIANLGSTDRVGC
jgi:aspartate ammonia-lyase